MVQLRARRHNNVIETSDRWLRVVETQLARIRILRGSHLIELLTHAAMHHCLRGSTTLVAQNSYYGHRQPKGKQPDMLYGITTPFNSCLEVDSWTTY